MKVAYIALSFGALGRVAAQAREASLQSGPRASSTYFDGVEVPPIWQMYNTDADVPTDWNRIDIDAELKQTKYMVVKYGSAYTSARAYQTLYEYYYTSGLPANAELDPTVTATTFEEYHDLRFAIIDCLGNPHFCEKHHIIEWPRVALYRNGELLDFAGGLHMDFVIGNKRSMENIANLIENSLMTDFPNTRPQKHILPNPGATSRPVIEETPKVLLPTEESQRRLGASEPI